MSRRQMTVMSSVAPFLPTSVSGLQVWLDPTDNSTITQSGGTCSQINDKSTNAYAFTQSTSTRRPSVTANAINSKQAFTFNNNATYAFMGATLSANLTNCTVMCIVKCSTNVADTEGYFVSYGNTSDLSICAGASNSIEVYLASVGHTAVSPNNTFNTGTTYLVAFTYSTSGVGTITTYINNSSQTASTQGSTPRQINKACGWGGDTAWGAGCNAILGDCVVYNVVLGSTDMTNLYNKFFKPKWGLP